MLSDQKGCSACNGSGYYDTDGSPPCSCCSGTGKKEISKKDLKILEALNAIDDFSEFTAFIDSKKQNLNGK